MNESNPNNLEGQKPLSRDEIEALKKRIAESEQAQASEMLTAMETGKTQERGVSFDSGRPDDKLANQASEALQIKPEAQKTPEIRVSDKTQEFIDELAKAKSQDERIVIMNKALAASQKGELSPNEASEILGQTNNFQKAA